MSKLAANTVVGDNDSYIPKRTDSTIVQRLLEFIYGLDTEFPLSGGETSRELDKNMQNLKFDGSMFAYSADNKFPLAGS